MNSLWYKSREHLIIAFFLILVMIIIVAAPEAKADGTSGSYTYKVNEDGTCIITGYNGEDGKIMIPDTITDESSTSYKVTSIGDNAFFGNTAITSIMIPNGISNIGVSAFSGCSNLHMAYFLGNAPETDKTIFDNSATGFNVYYTAASTGFSDSWNGYPAAVFNPNVNCVVTFDLNGASGTVPKNQTIYEGVKAICPEDPAYDGKIFGGWFTESACENVWSFDTPITNDITLYAKWKDFNGSGTKADPYQVSNLTQLDLVRNYLNATFIMTKNIDLSDATSQGGAFYNNGAGWVPIGTKSNPFTGSFNGNGHKISGLNINIPRTDTSQFAGLFGYLSGTVTGLTIQSGNISDYVNDSCVGAIAGDAVNATITDCKNSASITSGTNVSTNYAGGIAGRSYNTTIKNCSNTGTISSLISYAAGIVGFGERSTIDQCQNSGFITGIPQSGYDTHAGGISGRTQDYMVISNCLNIGRIKADCTGGISASCSNSSISNCYNAGLLIGNSLLGQISASQNFGTFAKCYYIDPLLQAGYNANQSGNPDIIAKTDADFKQQATFAGFDFDNVWTMAGNETYPYPELKGVEMIPPTPENTNDFAGGNGTYYAPYLIKTPRQLDNVRNYSGGCFSLQNDIDLTQYIAGKANQTFDPIGGDKCFFGIFWGNGHKIAGLKQTLSTLNAGFFGGYDGLIAHLGLEGVNISVTKTHHISVGAFSGNLGGTIYQCWSTGIIQATASDTANAGGIAGSAYNAQILECCNMATVNAKNSRTDYTGGIAGFVNGSVIQNCMNTGSIWGVNNIGGIAGYLYGTDTLKNCYNTGLVRGKRLAGSICGDKGYNSIYGCYFLDNIPRLTEDSTDLSSARSDEQLRQQSAYTGFDFDSVWTIKTDGEYPYAQLQNVNVPITVTDNTDFAGGNGTSYAPFIISDASQLNKIRNYPDAYFELDNDIDISSLNWDPVGTEASPFAGYLNGKGHRVIGLHISISGGTTVYAGMFGYLTGTVKNIKIMDASVTASGNTVYAGVLCGYSLNSYVQNCQTAGAVSTSGTYNYTGGIAGYETFSYISGCQNKSSIQCSNSSGSCIGGISGYHKGYYMLDCFNTGSIVNNCTDNYHCTGGITGYIEYGSITNCYNIGVITAQSGQQDYSGGVLGELSGGTTQNCYYMNNNPKGVGIGTDTGTSVKTDSEMRLQNTFTGYDFVSIWTIGHDENYGYPKLIGLENSNYKVIFNLNGLGSPNPGVQNITQGSKVIRPQDPVQSGYEFEGWYTTKECDNTSSVVFPYTVTDDATFYAKWNINNYTVQFDSQGGSKITDKSADYNTTITQPADPILTGYKFAGWYPTKGCDTTSIRFPYTVTNNTTLYAKWDINNYTVQFDSQGGSKVNNETADYNNAIAQPTDPIMKGYIFAGWYTKKECDDPSPVTFPYTVTVDTTFYAKWNINNHTVQFDSQGGSKVNDVSVNYNATIAQPIDPVMTGYIFDGWYTTRECNTLLIKFPYIVTEDMTFYAKWVSSAHTVTFDQGAGATVNPASKPVTYGDAYGSLPVPVKKNYDFIGWYTGTNGTGQHITSSDTVDITSDITLHAYWQAYSLYLSAININAGKLSPGFIKTKFNYTLNLGENIGSVMITPVKADAAASMTIDGDSTAVNKTVSLDNGVSQTVKVVISSMGKSKTYKIVVNRAKSTNCSLDSLSVTSGTLSPSFSPNQKNYTISLKENTQSVTINDTVAPHAKASFYSKTVTLKNPGDKKIIKLTVRAQSGRTRTYTIAVKRAKSA